MRDMYCVTAERLWEKLEAHKSKIDTSCVDFKEPFPIDQLTSKNPIVKKLIKEVEKEFDYGMSEFQCSSATRQFINGGLEMMEKFNEANGTDLRPRN